MSRWTYHLPVLAYHMVGKVRLNHVPTVSPEAFESQMAALARFRWRILPFDDVADCLDAGRPVPRKSVVINSASTCCHVDGSRSEGCFFAECSNRATR